MNTLMTLEEIQEYKNNWKNNSYKINVDSNLDVIGKDWCRKNLERHEWGMDAFTSTNEHTFIFEKEESLIRFKEGIGL